MKIRTILASLAGRSLKAIVRLKGSGGTSLPGKIALAIDPKFIRHSAANSRVVLVTGTNGKTITTTLIVRILKASGRQVITNSGGANMLQGVAAAFLTKASKAKECYYVLEVDEATLKYVTADLRPDIIVFTNLFKDQTDRYADVSVTHKHLLEGAAQRPDSLIIANGDVPLFHKEIVTNPVRYFGTQFSTEEISQVEEVADSSACPHCGEELLYLTHTYSNLGDYRCTSCGLRRPQLTWQLEEIEGMTLSGSNFRINGEGFYLPIAGIYNVYNALAAYAVAREIGISSADIRSGFAKPLQVYGRQESFQVEGKAVTLNLIKNPVGFNQIVRLLELDKQPFSLLVLLNDRPADGRDTTWIWEGDFEGLLRLTTGRPILLSGIRAEDLVTRFGAAGLDPLDAVIEKDQSLLGRRIAALPTEKIHVLSTYTALSELRAEWKKQGYIGK